MQYQPDTIFSDESLWQSWLDVEAALARVQAKIGLIPVWAGKRISKAAKLEKIGKDTLKKDIKRTLAPILSLTRLLADAAGDAGDYVHWGATTQNVMQTGRIILIRHANKETKQP